jgi:hypothetical protein
MSAARAWEEAAVHDRGDSERRYTLMKYLVNYESNGLISAGSVPYFGSNCFNLVGVARNDDPFVRSPPEL